MRDIKFRAWDKIKKQMSDVRVIDWLNKMVDLPYPDIEREWDINSNENEVVLMQYTGLKDNNEKEIYEGDIVKAYFEYKDRGFLKGDCREDVQVVNFSDLKFLYGKKDELKSVFDCSDTIEVIGNIYENPELMKGE